MGEGRIRGLVFADAKNSCKFEAKTRNFIMKISSGISIQNLRGKYVVVVMSSIKSPVALEVNDSFAILLEKVKDRDSFTLDDVKDAIVQEYGLEEEEAMKEAEKTISVWRENGILAD